MNPFVSVIIPNYNHADFLHVRIKSVLNQAYQNFEVIILDDASADNSQEVIKQYQLHPKIARVIYNEFNSGSTIKQWKRGIDLAQGEYIWIAESDDIADVHFLEKLIPILKENDSAALVYSQSLDIDEKGNILQNRLNWTNDFKQNIWQESFCIKGKDFKEFLFSKNVIPNVSACLVRKECLIEILEKAKDIEKLKMCGDWFVWLLVADKKNVSIAFVNEPLNYFRTLAQSTRNHDTRKKMARRLIEEAFIFNSAKFAIDKSALAEKNKSLKRQWFSLFPFYKISASFFEICPVIGINKHKLLVDYFKSRIALSEI